MGEIIKIEYASNDDISSVSTTDFNTAVNRENGSQAISANLNQAITKHIKFPTPYNSNTDILELQISRDRINWYNIQSFTGAVSIEGSIGLPNIYWQYYDTGHSNQVTAGIGLYKNMDENFIAMRYGQYRAIGGNNLLSNWTDIINPWYWRVVKKTFVNGEYASEYIDLENKPKINGVELVGDKSFVDLGLDISNYYTKAQTDAALNNKVTHSLIVPEGIASFDSLPIGYCRVDTRYTPLTNMPPIANYFNGTVLTSVGGSHIIQVAWFHNEGSMYYRDTGAGYWTPWKQIATTEPPTLYSFPVVTGLTAVGGYYKNQFKEVTIQVQINKTSGVFRDGEIIAYLPEGFRPKISMNYPVSYYTPDIAGSIAIYTDGRIIIKSSGLTNQQGMYINPTFLAL